MFKRKSDAPMDLGRLYRCSVRQVVATEVETGLLLWKFHLMGWHKSFVVGILLRLDMGYHGI